MLGDACKTAKTGELMVSVVAALGDVGIWNFGGDGVLGVLRISVMDVLSSR